MWEWLIWGSALVLFSWQGYRKGLVSLTLTYLGLVGGYVLAWWYFRPVGHYLQNQGWIEGLLAMAVAASGIFLAVVLGTKLLDELLRGPLAGHPGGSRRSLPGALGGAALGTAVAVLLVWLLDLAVSAQLLKPQPRGPLSELARQGVERVEALGAQSHKAKPAKQGISLSVRQQSEQQLRVKLLAHTLQNPLETAQTLGELAADPNLQAFFAAPDNRELLRSGQARALLDSPGFQTMVDHSQALEGAVALGVVDETLPVSQQQAQLAELVSLAWRKIEAARNDPRVQRLLQKPEVSSQLHNRDIGALIHNPDFEELLDVLLTIEPVAASGEPGGEQDIFFWRDGQGVVHYSHDKPAS